MKALLTYRVRRWWAEKILRKEVIGCCAICFKAMTIEDFETPAPSLHRCSKLVQLFIYGGAIRHSPKLGAKQ